MKQWITKFAMFLLPLAIAFIPMNANAVYDAYNPCCVNPCKNPCNPGGDLCSGYSFGADFLWWKPCVDDLNFAFQTDVAVTTFPIATTVTGRYRHIDPKWEPGVRGFITIENVFCGMDLTGTYSWIYVSKRNALSGAGINTLFSTQFNPSLIGAVSFAQLSSKYRLNYQTFDVLLSSEHSLCSHIFIPFFGITGVFIDQKIHTNGTTAEVEGPGVVDDLRWHSECWGVGLKVGSEYNYAFCNGWGFFASAAGAIVAGENESKRNEIRGFGTTTPVTLSPRKDDHCHFLNGFHLATGLAYEGYWCNWDFTLRIGYEFVKWYYVPTLRRFQGITAPQIATSSSPFTTTLGFHGLFAGLSLNF